MKVQDQDITFVVQGPVQSTSDREQRQGITEKCLLSIKHYFPKSKIILATWEGQNHQGLVYDLVLELNDPGQNTIYHDDQQVLLNNNRQLYSTYMGLNQVRTKYAVKMRTDSLITGRGFVDLYEKYAELDKNPDYCLFNSRVVTSSTFFLSAHAGKATYFHKSDLFDFGETIDLLKIWDGHLVPEIHFESQPGYKSRFPATEQFLCLGWLSRLLGKSYQIKAKAGDDAGLGEDYWKNFIANNLLVDCAERIGLDVTERFYHRGNLSQEIDLADWKEFVGLGQRPWDKKRIKRMFKKIEASTIRFLIRKS